ncbi:hypothetical protein WUBG_11700 [Wuchereria bancrofti]|uniref:Uncharacterized protein n=1 Tax=Wuchereria bancrofti TaxID=6293 RepID=J9EK19_WUCBA|nr:hypothetical protein WUBG_11700 [Wuchereria bancrofti]
MSDSELKKIGEKRTKDQLTDIRKLWADVANKQRKRKDGIRTKAGDYNRAIDQSIELKQELAEIEKSLKKYKVLERFERFGDTSNISEQSDLFFEVFADDDDDFYSFADVKTLPIKAPTSPAPTTPPKENNAKIEAVERPAPTSKPIINEVKNNENKAKEVLATKAPTAPALDKKPQAQLSPGLATQNTPTPPKAQPQQQAKTAQQQPLQTKPTPPQPQPQSRAGDKAPVKPPIATQEPPPQEQQKPLTAYDRPINQYYDILATHKRSFAKQNDISTVKNFIQVMSQYI